MKKYLLPLAVLLVATGITACSDTEPAKDAKVVDAPKPRVQEVVHEVTPQACLDALDASEELVHGPVVGMSDILVTVFDMMPRAMEAGMDMDVAAINQLTTETKRITREIEGHTADTTRIVAAYNAAADACRSASGKGA